MRSRTSQTPLAITLVVLIAGLAAGCSQEEPAPPEPPAAVEEAPPAATAEAAFASNDGVISGTATFAETDSGVEIHVSVIGAPAGVHGFHIHETGDCSAADFTSAGGHFNPDAVPHGGPDDAVRHAGDLGNIEIDEEGNGHLMLTSDAIIVGDGPSSVLGRAVILHAKPDDLVSQPTGDAGARLACGVIEATS